MSQNTNPTPTLRRLIEQARHCLSEASNVVENREDTSLALADVEQAMELLARHIMPALRLRISVRKASTSPEQT